MNLKRLPGRVIVCAAVFLAGCTHSADVWVDNQDPAGWSMVVMLDDQTNTVYAGNPLP